MTVEQGLRLVAGIVVTTSVLLAVLHSPYWLILTAFVGLNLLQSGFTNTCPMVWVLKKLGLKPCVVPQEQSEPAEPASQQQSGAAAAG